MDNNLSIRCNTRSEAEYIELYLLEQGYYWETKNDSIIINYVGIQIDFPIIIFNYEDEFDYQISWRIEEDFHIDFIDNIIDAKYLMRKEKLKRINN